MEGKSPVPLCTLCQGRPQDLSLPARAISRREIKASRCRFILAIASERRQRNQIELHSVPWH